MAIGTVNVAQAPIDETKFLKSDQLGQPNGVAQLDESGKLPDTQIPSDVARLNEDGKLDGDVFPTNVGGKRAARYTVGSSAYGWTAADCDYLCDGTADQTEINAAITALRETGGEVVLLDGQYKLTGAIVISKNNVTLRGNGNNTKIIRGYNDASGAQGLVRINATHCVVRDLYFDGVKGTYTQTYNRSIYIYGNYNAVRNCVCVNSGYAAIQCGGDYIQITGNTCMYNVSSGVTFNSSDYAVIADNVLSFNDDHGIALNTVDHSTITGNVCSENGMNGMDCIACDNNVIVGNTFNGNTDAGLDIYSGTNNIVSGNTINANGGYGVTLQSGSSANQVLANAMVGNTSGQVSNAGTSNAVGVVAKSGDTMVGTLKAGTQTPETYLVRNEKLSSAAENPTVNGEICWQYA